MRSGTFVYRFGPLDFDPTGRLFRGSTPIPLSEPQCRMLRRLIEKAGQVISQAALVEEGWRGVTVAPDSVRQSISRLRKALAGQDGIEYIETVTNQGYRFTGRVERAERYETVAPDVAETAAYQAFVRGRADLFTLDLDRIRSAEAYFIQALESESNYVQAHVGLANTGTLIFEASRVEVRSDVEALARALRHVRRAIERAPFSGEARSAHAHVLYLHGDGPAAAAEARHAITLEPDDCLHYLRLGYISWGQERIRPARTALLLFPGLALAHWEIATVLIARGAFAPALHVLEEGCRAQDEQSLAPGSFAAVGLHLLRGLVFAAQNRLVDAEQEFRRELAVMARGQLFARECEANTWYALGAICARLGRRDESAAAFCRSLQAAPGHVAAMAALGRPLPERPEPDRLVETAIARVIALVRAGQHCEAAVAYRSVIQLAPSAGWLLPAEPLIDVAAHWDIWHDVLLQVRARAV